MGMANVTTAGVVRQTIEWAWMLGLATLAFALLRNHTSIITFPTPLDYYEGTVPLVTGLIARGIDPYGLAQQPVYAYVYPPLYNLIVAPLTLVFGNTFLVHRLVSAAFIAACCALLGAAARYAGARQRDAIGAALLLYGALLYYSTPVASTNATGEFLFLATVLLPWMRNFDRRSLALSVACAVLAFYAKQYFVLGAGIVAAWLFIAVSKQRAITYAAGAFGTLAVTLWAVHSASPYFLDDTLFSVRNLTAALKSYSVLGKQLVFFAGVYPGLLLIGVLTGATALRRICTEHPFVLHPQAMLRGSSLPNQPLPYIWFCFGCTTAAIVLVLGLNPGNFMTYLFQLMSPFLLLGVLAAPALRGRYRALILPLLLLTAARTWQVLPRDFNIDLSRWDRARELVSSKERILASPILVMSLLEQGRAIHQGGQTFYFRLAENKPSIFRQTNPAERPGAIWNAWLAGLYARIRAGEFELLLLTPWDVQGIFEANPPPEGGDGVAELNRHYEITETFPISMSERPGGGTFPMQVWRPRAGSQPEAH